MKLAPKLENEPETSENDEGFPLWERFDEKSEFEDEDEGIRKNHLIRSPHFSFIRLIPRLLHSLFALQLIHQPNQAVSQLLVILSVIFQAIAPPIQIIVICTSTSFCHLARKTSLFPSPLF